MLGWCPARRTVVPTGGKHTCTLVCVCVCRGGFSVTRRGSPILHRDQIFTGPFSAGATANKMARIMSLTLTT